MINKKPMLEVNNLNDVYERKDKIKGNQCLGIGILEPGVNMNNANRNIMWCGHFSQTPVLANSDKPEFPLVFTRFENQVAKYSSGYKQAKKNYTVEAKLIKNGYKYYLILKDDEDNYDIIERIECYNRTEYYGWKNNNEYLDSLDIGDTIEKDDILYANTSYDDYMNFCYGKNLLAVFFSNRDKTHEDCCLMTKKSIKKFEYNVVYNVKVNVNTNDLLLNLFGDDENYKCFPDIGEEISFIDEDGDEIDQILCERRRIDYNKALVDLRNLREWKQGDDTFYKKGTVVDIEVYCNNDVEKLRKDKYNEQIVKYIDNDMEFYQESISCLEDLVENYTDQCSDELIRFYNECKMILDEGNYFEDEATKFDNLVIKFTILYKKPINLASKVTNRYGGKGVVGETFEPANEAEFNMIVNDAALPIKIIPDNEMPIVEEGPFKGLQAEICLNPLGVNNRKNYFQLIEQEINFVGLYVRKAIHDEKNLKKKEKILLTFYEKLLCFEQAEMTKDMLSTLDKKEKEHFFNLYVNEGIPVHQGPFEDHIDFFDLDAFQAYYEETLGVEKFKFKGIENPMVMGEIYYIVLKHSPDNKNSFRSTKFMDLRNNPSKDRLYKQSKALYPSTSVKCGEQEVIGLMNCDHYEIIKEIKNAYGNNEECEEILERELLTGNPFDINIKFPNTENKVLKIGKELFYNIGVELYNDDNTIDNPKEIISEKRRRLMEEEED